MEISIISTKSHDSYMNGNDVEASFQFSELGESPLTPYQGTERRLGHFRCNRCNKNWKSAHSWANTCQKCMKCEQDVYPHVQVIFFL